MHRWFAPPLFASEEQTQRARIFHFVVWMQILLSNVFLIVIIAEQPATIPQAGLSLLVVNPLGLAMLELNRRGRTRLASILFLAGFVILMTALSLTAGGIRASGVTGYIIIVLAAGVLLGERAAIATALVCAVLGLGLVLIEEFGILPQQRVQYGPVTYWLLSCLFMGLVIVFVRLTTQSVAGALRRAESELTERRNLEHRLEQALEAGAIGFWDHDLRTNTIRCDERALAMLGLRFKPGQAISLKACRSVVHAEDLPVVLAEHRALLEGRNSHARVEYRVVRPDGAERRLQVSASMLLGEGGRPARTVGTVIDVTEQREVEREREQLVGKLEKRVKEVRLLHDAAQLLRDAPVDRELLARLASMLPDGWMYPECCQARIAYEDIEVTTPEWRDSPWRLSAPVVTSAGNGVIEVAYLDEPPPASDGPFLAEEKQLIGSLAELLTAYLERDETERRRQLLEAQLRQSQKMEALGTLAGGIAHDFNNILGTIQGFAQILASDLAQGTQQHGFARRVLAACDRGKEVVEQILAFARAGVHERLVVDLAHTVDQCEALLAASLPKSTRLQFVFPGEPLHARAHAGQIAQLILNLCRNASDSLNGKPGRVKVELYRPARGEIAALKEFQPRPDNLMIGTVDPSESYACIRVSDNGSGIPPEILKRIFDPFFTTKGRQRGTGLGLAVVHGVIESHSGVCCVESTPSGTRFSFYLPITDEAPQLTAVSVASAKALRGRERVLIVDDEPDMADMLAIGLDRLGYDVAAVNDPLEALSAFEEDPGAWDAVIADQLMPQMRGVELLRRLKVARPNIKTVLCTGFSEGVEGELVASGAIDLFVQKPTDPDSVASSLRILFDKTDRPAASAHTH